MNNLHSQIFQILQVDNSTRDLMFLYQVGKDAESHQLV